MSWWENDRHYSTTRACQYSSLGAGEDKVIPNFRHQIIKDAITKDRQVVTGAKLYNRMRRTGKLSSDGGAVLKEIAATGAVDTGYRMNDFPNFILMYAKNELHSINESLGTSYHGIVSVLDDTATTDHFYATFSNQAVKPTSYNNWHTLAWDYSTEGKVKVHWVNANTSSVLKAYIDHKRILIGNPTSEDAAKCCFYGVGDVTSLSSIYSHYTGKAGTLAVDKLLKVFDSGVEELRHELHAAGFSAPAFHVDAYRNSTYWGGRFGIGITGGSAENSDVAKKYVHTFFEIYAVLAILVGKDYTQGEAALPYIIPKQTMTYVGGGAVYEQIGSITVSQCATDTGNAEIIVGGNAGVTHIDYQCEYHNAGAYSIDLKTVRTMGGQMLVTHHGTNDSHHIDHSIYGHACFWQLNGCIPFIPSYTAIVKDLSNLSANVMYINYTKNITQKVTDSFASTVVGHVLSTAHLNHIIKNVIDVITLGTIKHITGHIVDALNNVDKWAKSMVGGALSAIGKVLIGVGNSVFGKGTKGATIFADIVAAVISVVIGIYAGYDNGIQAMSILTDSINKAAAEEANEMLGDQQADHNKEYATLSVKEAELQKKNEELMSKTAGHLHSYFLAETKEQFVNRVTDPRIAIDMLMREHTLPVLPTVYSAQPNLII